MADLSHLDDLDIHNFTEKNWRHMNEKQKLDALKDITIQACQKNMFHLTHTIDLFFHDYGKGITFGDCGQSSDGTIVIRLSSKYFLKPSHTGTGLEAISTLFHELTHAEQHCEVESLSKLQDVDKKAQLENNLNNSYTVCTEDIRDKDGKWVALFGQPLAAYFPGNASVNRYAFLFYCAQIAEQDPHIVGDQVVKELKRLGEFRYGKGVMGEPDKIEFSGHTYKDRMWKLYQYFPVCPEIDPDTSVPGLQDKGIKELLKAINMCQNACRSFQQKYIDPRLYDLPVYHDLYVAYMQTAALVGTELLNRENAQTKDWFQQNVNMVINQMTTFYQTARQNTQDIINKTLPYVNTARYDQYKKWIGQISVSPQGLFIAQTTSDMIRAGGLNQNIQAVTDVLVCAKDENGYGLSYGGVQAILNQFVQFSPRGAEYIATAPDWIPNDTRDEMMSYNAPQLTQNQEQIVQDKLKSSIRDKIIVPSKWKDWIGTLYENAQSESGLNYISCLTYTLNYVEHHNEIPSQSMIEKRLRDFHLEPAMQKRFEEDLSKFGNVQIQYDLTPEQRPKQDQTIQIYQENSTKPQAKSVQHSPQFKSTDAAEFPRNNISIDPFSQLNITYRESVERQNQAVNQTVQVDNWNYNLQSENSYDDHFRDWAQPEFSDSQYPSQEPDIIPNEHTQLENQMNMQQLQGAESSEYNPNAFVNNAYGEEEDGYDDVGDDARNFDEDGWEEEYDEEYDDIPAKRDDDEWIL